MAHFTGHPFETGCAAWQIVGYTYMDTARRTHCDDVVHSRRHHALHGHYP